MNTYWVLQNGSIECRVATESVKTSSVVMTNVEAAVTTELPLAANHHRGSRGRHNGLSGLRLTRRGRVWFAALSLALSVPLFGAGAVAAASSPPQPETHISYTVAAGESLWTIAERYKELGTDTRDAVYRIKRLNHMSTSDLYAGQVIYVG